MGLLPSDRSIIGIGRFHVHEDVLLFSFMYQQSCAESMPKSQCFQSTTILEFLGGSSSM